MIFGILWSCIRTILLQYRSLISSRLAFILSHPNSPNTTSLVSVEVHLRIRRPISIWSFSKSGSSASPQISQPYSRIDLTRAFHSISAVWTVANPPLTPIAHTCVIFRVAFSKILFVYTCHLSVRVSSIPRYLYCPTTFSLCSPSVIFESLWGISHTKNDYFALLWIQLKSPFFSVCCNYI